MKPLKTVLLVNSVSSGAAGLLLIVLSGIFAGLFGASQTMPFRGVGIFLVVFAFYVYLQSRKDPPPPNSVRLIIFLDILWVIGSLVIIVPQLFNLTSMGYVLTGIVALWVASMAILQLRGLKELTG